MAFLDTVMVNGDETLVDPHTKVDVNTGMIAAGRLQSLIDSRADQSELLQMRLQFHRILDAVRSTVPQEMWGAIADKLFVTGPPRGQERLEHRGGRRIDGVVKHCPPRAQFVTVTLPYSMERSTFVVLTSSVLFLVYWQWRTMPAVVWDVTSPAGRLALHVLFWFGWAIALAATFMINHLDLFGLRQVYLAWRGQPYTDLGFRTFLLCRLVRHPLMLGFIIAFWATPTMTAGHLPYAIATTGLHPDRGAAGRTRPGGGARQPVPRLSASGSHAHTVATSAPRTGDGAGRGLLVVGRCLRRQRDHAEAHG
jgi:protein-S-isoprenylcysteine O-methyltransferase Ste14